MTALIAVFLGGLMVGRTPEYLGKTIRTGEAKWVALYALLTPAVVLLFTGLAAATDAGRAGLTTNEGRVRSPNSCSHTPRAWGTTDRRWPD